MRKIVLAMAMSVCSVCVMAQQAIWCVPQFKSPEVNADKTVTFRFVAPDAKEVKVTGDFLTVEKVKTPYGEFEAPGSALLTKDDKGMWTFTTSVLSPELYS